MYSLYRRINPVRPQPSRFGVPLVASRVLMANIINEVDRYSPVFDPETDVPISMVRESWYLR